MSLVAFLVNFLLKLKKKAERGATYVPSVFPGAKSQGLG